MKIRAFILIVIAMIGTVDCFAAVNGGCIPGTYLVQEGSGVQSLWTFSKDGTVQFASSAQGLLNFSEGHGAWKQLRNLSAKATILDFSYGSSPSPAAIARVDAEITFSKKCSTMQGTFELRFFDPDTEDALDVNSDSGEPILETFTGRRVRVVPKQ